MNYARISCLLIKQLQCCPSVIGLSEAAVSSKKHCSCTHMYYKSMVISSVGAFSSRKLLILYWCFCNVRRCSFLYAISQAFGPGLGLWAFPWFAIGLFICTIVELQALGWTNATLLKISLLQARPETQPGQSSPRFSRWTWASAMMHSNSKLRTHLLVLLTSITCIFN